MKVQRTPAGAPAAPRGRGAAHNPPIRFEALSRESEPGEPEAPSPATRLLKDASKSALTSNDSPDIGFEASLNPYRGCEHGCAYCYARPTHEYLGLSAGLDFETRILVKERAPELLRAELLSRSWTPKTVALSGVTDAYQPAERGLGLTRRCLEVLAEFGNPVLVVTKNRLVTRDIDLLSALAARGAAAVVLSITTLDRDLARRLEPRTSEPLSRLEAVRALAAAGIPTGVNVAPVLPGLTDHELPGIVRAAAEAGASFAGYGLLRLPHGVAALFEDWLDRNAPERKAKVLNSVRSARGGRLNDPRFGSRFSGTGVLAKEIADLHRLACRRAGLEPRWPELSTASFRRPPGPQMELFEIDDKEGSWRTRT